MVMTVKSPYNNIVYSSYSGSTIIVRPFCTKPLYFWSFTSTIAIVPIVTHLYDRTPHPRHHVLKRHT